MRRDKYKVWIEAEEEWNIHNDNTDVIVEFDIGDRWRASFFTYSNINKLIENNKNTGECLYGKYFWASNMLLVDEVSRKRIQEVIDHLLDENKFECVFKKCCDE